MGRIWQIVGGKATNPENVIFGFVRKAIHRDPLLSGYKIKEKSKPFPKSTDIVLSR